jgi:menaquinone-9 beta-reductase
VDKNNFDVVIVGAGPAGSCCAIKLAGSGLRVALVDKASFPRDKICGDALNIDVVNQLAYMDEKLSDAFAKIAGKTASYGINVFSDKYDSFAIPLYHNKLKSCGYVMKRYEFDNFLYQYAKAQPGIECFENCMVQHIEEAGSSVTITAGAMQLQAKMLVGADGAHSIIAKKLAKQKVEKEHYSAGLRQYYKGVTGFHNDNLIELHFLKEIAPGYFWMFPMPGGGANIGIGMNSAEVAKKKLNLRKIMHTLITEHPQIKERFRNATALETVKGYGLPLGGKKRALSGDNFLLVGDAAALIDPLSGEGIGNAVRSGRIAAQHISGCFANNDFSASYNRAYDKLIYEKMWHEFRISRLLMRVASRPWLTRLIIRKANSVSFIRHQLIDALGSLEKRGSLLRRPGFYLSLLVPGRKKKGPVNNRS